uniref:Methyltranfer_dom domain-containing protein n=1 Tax=Strongyloides stercoralis TaxID=6248 RepID=A0A0K0ECH7_STRER
MVGVSNVVNVTGINVLTKSKSLLRLSQIPSFNKIKTPREAHLPKLAIEGLKVALTQCQRLPKQLQHEADVLHEKISQRRFPASKAIMLAARNVVLKRIKESESNEVDGDVYGNKIKEGHKEYFNSKVAKELRQINYNWKPLVFDNVEKAAAYALGLLSSNYSEVYRVLCEFDDNKFVPETVLDFGSGIGGSFWACNEKFGDAVKEYTLIDSNPIISNFAMDIMRSGNSKDVFVHPNVNFRRSFVPSLQTKYDLVIAHRSLIEFPNPDTRMELVKSLWERTNKYLIFIDSHMEDSFDAILEARDYIIKGGKTIDYSKFESIINEHGILNNKIHEIMNNNKISDFEKYYLIKSKIPENINLPTILEPGHVFSPCPHDKSCPKQELRESRKYSCNFSIKYKDIRADGKKTKLLNGTGNTSFSYVILQKGDRERGKEFNPRLIKYIKANKHYTCHGCTSFFGIQQFVVSKKNQHIYQLTKGLSHGDKIPYKIDVEKNLKNDEYTLEEEIYNLRES